MRDRFRQTMDRFAVAVNSVKSAAQSLRSKGIASRQAGAAHFAACAAIRPFLTIKRQLYRLNTAERLCEPDAESADNIVKSTESGCCRRHIPVTQRVDCTRVEGVQKCHGLPTGMQKALCLEVLG